MGTVWLHSILAYYSEVQLYLICLYYTIHVIFAKINHLQVSVFEGIFARCGFTVAPRSRQFFSLIQNLIVPS